jgi:hypothetical protein
MVFVKCSAFVSRQWTIDNQSAYTLPRREQQRLPYASLSPVALNGSVTLKALQDRAKYERTLSA